MRNEKCWYEKVCQNECKPNCIRYLEMEYLMSHSNLPVKKQCPQILKAPNEDYKAFCELADIKDDIERFVADGENLYITSREVGNGKTSWAIKLLLRYFNEIWAGNCFRTRGLFIHVPTFLLQCKNFNYVDEEFETLKYRLPRVDLVVWDDVAAGGMSAYDYSQLMSYIEQRQMAEKSNIFTGNLNETELKNTLGDRLASRIWNASTVIELKGKDMRNKRNTIN
jgi:DNA replication protein DnaC